MYWKLSKFQFLPPIFNFLTLITPFSKFSSKLPHLAKVLPIFTPSRILWAFWQLGPGRRVHEQINEVLNKIVFY
jgi:hypothetical protein